MKNKKLSGLMVTAVFLTIGLVFAMALFRRASLEDLLAGVTVLVIYSLVLFFYLSRIVLIFLGFFAVYKVLRARANLGSPL